ncbi:hypothetical protein CENSYa_1563 [Cenarchaeum symbiosum A]|uniref:Uncharacterized protein n=1 Tax=Cenarchaeum symbiosum (strain A) TaxID=414004 RepID=A0RXW6_CENSY|nr:hypothetical protein CENSYa_1563 [Cenarchaeum symbiosum A]
MNKKTRKKRRHGAGPRQPGVGPPAGAHIRTFYLALLKNISFADPDTRAQKAAEKLTMVIGDPPSLKLLTGRSTGEFAGILEGFGEAIKNDGSRPVFRGDPDSMTDETGMQTAHLLLFLLAEPRVGPAGDGLAAAFGMEPGAAEGHLEYGRSILAGLPASREGLPARIMDAIHRGAYGEAERLAPDFMLLFSMRQTSYNPGDDSIGHHAVPPDAPGRPYTLLTILTRGLDLVDAWAVPEGDSRISILEGYLKGDGAYLLEMTRPMPGGRWQIVYGAGLEGMEEMFPGVAVRPQQGGGAEAAAGYAGLRRLFPGAEISLERTGPRRA